MADDVVVEVSVPEHTTIPSSDNSVWVDVLPLLESTCKGSFLLAVTHFLSLTFHLCLFPEKLDFFPSPKPKAHPFLPPKSKPKTQILPPPPSPPPWITTTKSFGFPLCIMRFILYLLLFSIENQTSYPKPRYACFCLSLLSKFKFFNWNQTEER